MSTLFQSSAALVLALRAIKYATGPLDAKTTSAHLGAIRVLAIHVIRRLT